MYTWGSNRFGQLGRPNSQKYSLPCLVKDNDISQQFCSYVELGDTCSFILLKQKSQQTVKECHRIKLQEQLSLIKGLYHSLYF